MAKLTGDLVKADQHIWVAAYNRKTETIVPIELIILNGAVNTDSTSVQVAFVTPEDSLDIYDIHSDPRYGSAHKVVYLGDSGVRPYSYDNRCTQIFTTKEEMQAAIILWARRNPNCLDDDGKELGRKKSELL